MSRAWKFSTGESSSGELTIQWNIAVALPVSTGCPRAPYQNWYCGSSHVSVTSSRLSTICESSASDHVVVYATRPASWPSDEAASAWTRATGWPPMCVPSALAHRARTRSRCSAAAGAHPLARSPLSISRIEASLSDGTARTMSAACCSGGSCQKATLPLVAGPLAERASSGCPPPDWPSPSRSSLCAASQHSPSGPFLANTHWE
mmetsp:Transcript_17093/g.42441  ORF Transcript_17093/g.42441 Transcript_17093/m.42441 type:complete len:205 (-) Transcript_17093:79-693(-)